MSADNTSPVDTLGKRIKHAMAVREIKNNELDRLMGMKGYVSRLANDQRPKASGETIARAAKALRVRVAWLLSGEEPMDDETSDAPEIELSPEEIARRDGELTEPDAETPTPSPGETGDVHIVAPKMRNMRNFDELIAGALEIDPSTPQWVVDRYAGSNAMFDGGTFTSAGVVELLRYIRRHTPPPPGASSEPARAPRVPRKQPKR